MSVRRASIAGLAWKNSAPACFSRSTKSSTPGTAASDPIRARCRKHAHQRLHRHHRGPPRGDVIAQVHQPARLEPPRHRADQMAAVGRRDPAQHAVRHHEVEIRQRPVGHGLQVGERAFDEPNVGQAGTGGEAVGELDMRRIEVEPPDIRVRAGGGDDQRGEAVAAAQVGIAERAAPDPAADGRAAGWSWRASSA